MPRLSLLPLSRCAVVIVLAASLFSACDSGLFGSDEGPPESAWKRQGPYVGYVSALSLAPDSRAFALSAPDRFSGGVSVYEQEAPGAPWTEAHDDGAGFVYAGVSGRVYTGRSSGGMRWRTAGGGWRNEADAFREPSGCESFLGVRARVYAVIEWNGKTLAGTHCGLFEVVDRFVRVAFEGEDVTDLTAVAGRLVALVDGRVYVSQGGVGVWEQAETLGGKVSAVFGSAEDRDHGSAVYARRGQALWRTEDGQAWTKMGDLPTSVRAGSVYAASGSRVVFVSGTESEGYSWADVGLFQSGDGGETWTRAQAPQEQYAALAAEPGRWVAASPTRGLLCEREGGDAAECGVGLAGRIETIVPSAGGLFAYTGTRGVYRYDGAWEYRDRQRGEELLALGATLVIPGGGDLTRSDDGGTTWSEETIPFSPYQLTEAPSGDLVALDSRGALWSRAAGSPSASNWREAPHPAPGYALTRGLDGALYLLGLDGQLYAKSSAGDWAAHPASRLGAALIDPNAVDERIAVAADGTVFFRANGRELRWDGSAWQDASVSLRALTADARSGRLFAGDERVAEWRDGGWADLGALSGSAVGVVAWEGELHAWGHGGAFVRAGD